MNAITMVSKTNSSRLKRIQKVSRNLKICVLLYFVAPLCCIAFNFKSVHLASGMVSLFNYPYASVSDIPAPMYVLSGIGTAVYLLGIISLYRLLCLYEKGVFFSAANVSQIKKLGGYLVVYGILAIVADAIHAGGFVFPVVLFEGAPPLGSLLVE